MEDDSPRGVTNKAFNVLVRTRVIYRSNMYIEVRLNGFEKTAAKVVSFKLLISMVPATSTAL